MSEVNDLFDTLLGGKAKKPYPAKTTDTPRIKLFMLQMIYAYSRLLTEDSMQWCRSFHNKMNGKTYTVHIVLTEEKS